MTVALNHKTKQKKKKNVTNVFIEILDASPKKTDLKYHRAKIVVLGGLAQDVTEEDVQKCLQKL